MENDSEKKTHYKLGLYEVLSLASCYFYGNLLRKQVHRLTSQSASRSIHSCLRWQQNCELPAAPCFWIRHAKLCLNVSLQNSMKIPLGTGFDTHTHTWCKICFHFQCVEPRGKANTVSTNSPCRSRCTKMTPLRPQLWNSLSWIGTHKFCIFWDAPHRHTHT